jgi:hypothetical protein
MNYNITIVKTEKNPNFDEEAKRYEEDRRYRNNYNPDTMPSREVIENVLTCHLTEEQFKKIKAAVLAVFE